jgi:peptidoglycan hydrolase CwlO-like protein
MGNRAIQKTIESLRRVIQEHQAKISLEQAKLQPQTGLIRHWQSEIQAFSVRLYRLEDRLAQRRRRGR